MNGYPRRRKNFLHAGSFLGVNTIVQTNLPPNEILSSSHSEEHKSYTVQYIDKFGFVPACHQSHKVKEQQFYDNLEICLRKEFDEKIANATSAKPADGLIIELVQRIDHLEEENEELRDEYDQKLKEMQSEIDILKKALTDTLATLAQK
jgi:hypothetical protein